MVLSKVALILVFMFNFIFPNVIEAKRGVRAVEPVIYNGIKYTADKRKIGDVPQGARPLISNILLYKKIQHKF